MGGCPEFLYIIGTEIISSIPMKIEKAVHKNNHSSESLVYGGEIMNMLYKQGQAILRKTSKCFSRATANVYLVSSPDPAHNNGKGSGDIAHFSWLC